MGKGCKSSGMDCNPADGCNKYNKHNTVQKELQAINVFVIHLCYFLIEALH